MSKNEEKTKDRFFQYMFTTLERSIEHSHRLIQQSLNSIQLFVTLVTAIAGGVILVLSSDMDIDLKLSVISVLLIIATSIAILTYLWILSAVFYEVRERPLRFFLEKYFRDMDPSAFKKYGLSDLLVPYSRFKNMQGYSISKRATEISLYSLGIFASVMIIAAGFTGDLLVTGEWLKIVSIIVGVICFVTLFLVERVITKRAEKTYEIFEDIFSNYHKNLDDSENDD